MLENRKSCVMWRIATLTWQDQEKQSDCNWLS